MPLLPVLLFGVVALLAPVAFATPAEPVFSDTGPEAAAYGAPTYPISPDKRSAGIAQQFLVGTYSHFDQIYNTRRLARADAPAPLRRAAQELTINYSFSGEPRSLADYLERQPATGLLLVRGDEILFEHYRYGRTDRDRLAGQSMTKTITASLFGIAVADGKIRSIEAPAAEYIPELAGSEYGKTPLRALLHMASGVTFREVYDGNDDIAKLGRGLFGTDSPGPGKAVVMFNEREATPDTHFHYASVETEILGIVVENAVKTPLGDYAQTHLWQPMGAEADASWVVDATGHETGFFGFSATLRDWARFGLLLANDGAWNGRQIIPRQWVIDATTVAAGEEFRAPQKATSFFGYGYQVWLFPGPRRQFALLGVHGQAVFVDPEARLVLAHTAARKMAARDPGIPELIGLWRAAVAQLTK